MSDPVETTQQAQQAAEQAAALTGGGILTVAGVLAAVRHLYVAVFGTRAERDAARVAEADAGTRAAAVVVEALEDQREETVRTRAQRDTCEERLAVMDMRMRDVERQLSEHMAMCVPRMARMEREQELSRTMLNDYMHSTPPPRYTGDDVRAAMAREEG